MKIDIKILEAIQIFFSIHHIHTGHDFLSIEYT